MNTGVVFNIQRFSVQDGPGIRTTVFLKGCPLDCRWCHNPESQSVLPQVTVMGNRCIRCGQCVEACPEHAEPDRVNKPEVTQVCTRCGECSDACPTGARQIVGEAMSVDQVIAEVLKDRVFHEDSKGGMTVSGGEPLVQAEFVQQLLAAAREQGVHTALDTCGFGPQDRLLATASLAGLVLYDVKLIDDQKHIHFTGASNVSILENLRTLAKLRTTTIWLRFPRDPRRERQRQRR